MSYPYDMKFPKNFAKLQASKLQASGPGTGKFCDISKNNFSHRTPPLNASEGIPLDFPCQLFRIMYGKLDLLDPSTPV